MSEFVKLPYASSNHPRSIEEQENIIKRAAKAYELYLDELGFDWRNDPNSSNTRMRVAKAFVNDIASGCYQEPPKVTAFPNHENYDGLVCQTNIEVNSLCSHHHLPFIGKAHVAYIPHHSGKVIGLSKINRIVEWYSRRPQIQEGLTVQIHSAINEVCKQNSGVAVIVEAKHLCCCVRGIKHNSTMRTAKMSGHFLDDKDQVRAEFYKFVEFAKND